jgi:hypothetical protein
VKRLVTLASMIALVLPASAAVHSQHASAAAHSQHASAAVHSQHASAGGVSATFSYAGSFPRYRALRLRIVRDGRTAYDRAVTSRYCSRSFPCGPFAPADSVAVHVSRLGSGREPAVVLGLYTGGAHCCVIGQVYSFSAARGTYVKAERDFYDAGFRLVDERHDGIDEFRSADDAFAYAFTDYAASGLPVEVLSFSGGRFRDVTRSYPKLIAADASIWIRAFREQAPRYSDTAGVIAAWAADEDELGRSGRVARFLAAQARAGHLRSALYPGLRGRRFITVLDRFLRRHGYLR